MANLTALKKSQSLQAAKTTGVKAPTYSGSKSTSSPKIKTAATPASVSSAKTSPVVSSSANSSKASSAATKVDIFTNIPQSVYDAKTMTAGQWLAKYVDSDGNSYTEAKYNQMRLQDPSKYNWYPAYQEIVRKNEESGSTGRNASGIPTSQLQVGDWEKIGDKTFVWNGNKFVEKETTSLTESVVPAQASNPVDGIVNGAADIYGDAVNQIVTAIKDMFPSATNFADLTDQELQDAMDKAEQIVGPHFTKLKEQAIQDFDLAQRFAKENLQTVFRQTKGDVETQKARMSRNLQEAVADSTAAMANRGLTFGGTRKKEREKLETATAEGVQDLTTNAQRKLEDAQKTYERSYGTSSRPSLEMPDFYSYNGTNETGFENINKQRTLDELTRQQETEKEKEYQTILENKRYGTLNL